MTKGNNHPSSLLEHPRKRQDIAVLKDAFYSVATRRKNNKTYALFPIAIGKKEGQLLWRVIQKVKPNVLFEIGLGYGAAHLWIELGPHRPKRHIVIDPYQEAYGNIGLDIIRTIWRSSTVVVKKTSQEYLPLTKQLFSKKVDFVYLDGDQKFDSVVVDSFFITKLLRVGGMFFIRNTWNPSVLKAVLFIIRNLPFTIYNASQPENMLIKKGGFIGTICLFLLCKIRNNHQCILQKTKEDTRSWRDYHSF